MPKAIDRGKRYNFNTIRNSSQRLQNAFLSSLLEPLTFENHLTQEDAEVNFDTNRIIDQ